MDNVGILLCSVYINIFHTELFCKKHIYLNGNDGILLAVNVVVLNIKLGSVECGFVNAYSVFNAKVVKDLLHCRLSSLPLLLCSFILVLGVCGIPLREAEGAVFKHTNSIKAVFCKLQTALEFFFKLLGSEDKMTLGNGELSYSDKTVHLSAVLVSEKCGGLAQSHRQISVGTLTVKEYLILERTGHRTESKALLFLVVGIAQNEHSVTVMIPVTRDLVKLSLCHIGCLCKNIAPLCLGILYPSLEKLDNLCALGEKYGKSLSDIVNSGEIFKLTSDLVVVTSLCFFNLFQIFFKLGSLGECRSVNTAKLLALGIASPVCACAVCKLECLYGCGGHKVRACAEVCKIALLVEADVLSLVAVLSAKLNLVYLALCFKLCDSFVGCKLET